ncbi:toprim domain-containing protein [Ruegeria jejuensis]|uniref:toprim domain-containing protein n=1 Tax=Ruegeria jejuensis TaxID=3233338 RepID=UPI00355B8820
MTMDVQTWLQSVRKLDGAVLADMGVKAISHPQLGESVAFPYRRNGEPYAGKFRSVEGKDWRSTQGVPRGLFNEDALKDEGPIVITEGEIDCLSVMQSGYLRAVSLPDGWTEDGGKRDCLLAEEARLRKSPFVIVAGDNDAAGRSLPKTVANILAGHEVKYAVWPDDCKDANDVLVKHGEGELSRCLVEAKTVDPEGGFITGISDMPPLPPRRVLRVGMTPYDFCLAFEVGAMSVGTGTPGSGKSTFTTFAAFHIAKHENIQVGFLSFETHPHRTRDHLARLQTGKPWDALSEPQRVECGAFLDRHFRIVHRTYDDTPGHNLGWLQSMIYTLAVRDNCKLIIVDPWNELEHMPEPGESVTNYINFALQQIRTWAEKYDTHICVIAHPRKMMTDGKPRSPTGYDIADSAAFANKPSLGFTVHQEVDEDAGEQWVRLSTWKVRDTQLYGFEKGYARLSFDSDRMNYRKFESAARYKT